MKFRDRIFFFLFGISLGIMFASFIFKGKMRKGLSDYFSGQDRIISFLINKSDLDHQLKNSLHLDDRDSIFIRDMIINSDVQIISRDSCFEYLLTPKKTSLLKVFTIEKCDKQVSLIDIETTN